MSNKIHPTAIIEAGAKIHESVTVGAYSIIGANVEIGEGCVIANHAVISGHTKLGKNNKIYSAAIVGGDPQDKKYAKEPTKLIIGDNNIIREFCTMNVGSASGTGITIIGDNNFFMAYSHVAHDCVIGNHTVFANNVSLGGHVVIKDWVILGGHSVVHQFCYVGEHVMVAGTTAITQDVPPYIMAVGYRAEPRGINLEGIKRRGFTTAQLDNIKHAYRLLYRNDLAYSEAKSLIAELAVNNDELKLFTNFFEKSTRGMIR